MSTHPIGFQGAWGNFESGAFRGLICNRPAARRTSSSGARRTKRLGGEWAAIFPAFAYDPQPNCRIFDFYPGASENAGRFLSCGTNYAAKGTEQVGNQVLVPFAELQDLQRGEMLSRSFEPPTERGTMWSSVSGSLRPHFQQRLP